MSDRTYSEQTFSPIFLLDGARECLANAESLLDDAELLTTSDRLPRAIFLTITAIEEFAKAGMLFDKATSRATLDDKAFWRLFRNHASKSLLISLLATLAIGERKAARMMVLTKLREKMLYVDLSGQRWTHPYERDELKYTQEFMRDVRELIEIDKANLAKPDHELLSANIQALDLSNPDIREVLGSMERIDALSRSIRRT